MSFVRILLAAAGVAALNTRPIIGVLTQPLNTEVGNSTHSNVTYIAASYVKFLEQAGARVVPVHYDSSQANLEALFRSINGVLFPGGGADLSKGTRIRRTAQRLYDLARASADAGDPFPLHGTCMGFQLMALLTAQDDSILCEKCYDSEGTPLPLDFTPAARGSRLFGDLSPALRDALATENITENSHHDGITPATFGAGTQGNARLHDFYDVLSINHDTTGAPFVSSMEAKHTTGYAFSATQWHPEKNNFEWGLKLGPDAIPHSAHAVQVSQYVANVFVEAARSSKHRFANVEAEQAALIYNDEPVRDPNGYYSQVYLWQR